MSDWYHPSLGLTAASSAFTLNDVQYPAGWLQTQQPEGFVPVQVSTYPDTEQFFVSEQVVNVVDGVAVVSWNTTPRDPADIQRTKDVKSNADIQAQLTALDVKSIRPLRAVLAAGKNPDAADVAFLADLKKQSDDLRAKLVVIPELVVAPAVEAAPVEAPAAEAAPVEAPAVEAAPVEAPAADAAPVEAPAASAT